MTLKALKAVYGKEGGGSDPGRVEAEQRCVQVLMRVLVALDRAGCFGARGRVSNAVSVERCFRTHAACEYYHAEKSGQ